jgi:sarcosine oxidase gamma subunit
MHDGWNRDLSETWPAPPDWPTAVLERADVQARTIAGLIQHLVSGNLTAYAQADETVGTGIGAVASVSGDRYALRLARDRMLAIGARGDLAQPGWHAAGFSVTDVSAAFHVFEFSGTGLPRLLAEAMLIDPEQGGPSAAAVFAATPAIVYRHGPEQRLRLHVERGLATSVWNWLETRSD